MLQVSQLQHKLNSWLSKSSYVNVTAAIGKKIGSENWKRDILVSLDICNHNDDSFLKILLVLRTNPSPSVQKHKLVLA